MSTAGGSIRFYVVFAWDQDIWTDYIASVHIQGGYQEKKYKKAMKKRDLKKRKQQKSEMFDR